MSAVVVIGIVCLGIALLTLGLVGVFVYRLFKDITQ